MNYCECLAYSHSIVWRQAWLWLIKAVCEYSRLILITVVIFVLPRFSLEMLWLYLEKDIGLCREILMFLAAIWSSLFSWSSMYGFIPSLMFLVPQDSNLTHYTQVCWLCCMLYMPLFGLVQARPWFRSYMWISSVGSISKVLCTSEVARATRTW